MAVAVGLPCPQSIFGTVDRLYNQGSLLGTTDIIGVCVGLSTLFGSAVPNDAVFFFYVGQGIDLALLVAASSLACLLPMLSLAVSRNPCNGVKESH
eukprot:scaffold2977_cov123-Amphora_coffeaeformis.AAC.2